MVTIIIFSFKITISAFCKQFVFGFQMIHTINTHSFPRLSFVVETL